MNLYPNCISNVTSIPLNLGSLTALHSGQSANAQVLEPKKTNSHIWPYYFLVTLGSSNTCIHKIHYKCARFPKREAFSGGSEDIAHGKEMYRRGYNYYCEIKLDVRFEDKSHNLSETDHQISEMFYLFGR